MNNLHKLQMKNNDFDDYVKEFFGLNQELRSIGEPLTLNWQKFFLFKGLDGRAELAKIDSDQPSFNIYQILAILQPIYNQTKPATIDLNIDSSTNLIIDPQPEKLASNAHDKPSNAQGSEPTVSTRSRRSIRPVDFKLLSQGQAKKPAQSASQSMRKRSTRRSNEPDADVSKTADKPEDADERPNESVQQVEQAVIEESESPSKWHLEEPIKANGGDGE